MTFSSSYEELVKKLKPCSVVFERLKPEKVSTLKVIDDPSRINDEKPIASNELSTIEIEEEEVEVDLAQTEADALKEDKVSLVF